MIFRFNKAQLGAKMEKALDTFTDAIQGEQRQDIEISAVDFPYKLLLKRTTTGEEAKISYDAEAGFYLFDKEPLPESIPTGKNVGNIKEWQRPEQAQAPEQPAQEPAPEPAPEIPLTVDSVVSMFMGLSSEQRTAFFVEVWRSIGEEGS